MFSTTCFSVTTILVICANLQIAQACNGYSMKVEKIENCVENGVATIENGDVVLDKDCNVILKGCMVIHKTFKSLHGSYRIEKPPMPPIEGEGDFCAAAAELRSPQIDQIAKTYNAPTKCPFHPSRICGSPDKKISIKKYKNLLGAALGTAKIHLEGEYDVGRTCIDITATISKTGGALGGIM